MRTILEICAIQKGVLAAAEESRNRLAELISEKSSLGLLHDLKFRKAAFDPLQRERELNSIEQLNQTFTCLVTLKAAEYLLLKHPNTTLILNLGTAKGTDVVSEDGSIAAEAFAATSPQTNDKLMKDIERIRKHKALHKYVFFCSPGHVAPAPAVPGVFIVQLESLLVVPRIPTFNSGGALVDAADREALYEAMEGPELRRLYGTHETE